MTDTAASVALSEALARTRGLPLPINDILFIVLPLMREVHALHEQGLVADLGTGGVLQDETGQLRLRRPQGGPAQDAAEAVRAAQPAPASALNVIDEVRVTRDGNAGVSVESLRVQRDPAAEVTKPVYLPGFDAWERRLGHHDALTDVFQLGQILACLGCGLDFNDPEDLERFAANRQNLFALDDRMNPVLANIIVEMTAVNRHQRATDLESLARRLETWRDQPANLDVDRVLAGASGATNRRTAVLSHLRDRLFDLSRRNRLLYFKPTQSTVNLTVASVPLVMRLESIRPNDICTWSGEFAKDAVAGKALNLRRWLRFEDQSYLPVSLDRLIQETRRDKAEYGFSNLRLVIAFLRWNNLKDAPDERIVSPLLWLPVELVKKKGVTDQYVLQADDGEAEFNPVLRHHLRQLHDIRLPETVDLDEVSLEQVHADLRAQIQRSEPGVDLRLVTRPSIRLIHQKAVQRLQQFQRRRGRELARAGVVARPDFSYDRSDYRPLGLALFEQQVKPSRLPIGDALGATAAPTPRHMAEPSAEAERLTYSLPEDEGHRYAWDLDLTQVTLANFNYKKMSLVRDYAQLIDEPAPNPAFDRIFSIEPRAVDLEPPAPLSIEAQWNVVPADATQNAAVSVARNGRSFIIQGPPGTGKSQTITNLIADYAGRGMRVLFVCEKRAALDVVFHRLKQSGLDDLCCLIHDSQADKKAFVHNLRERYAQWIVRPADHDRLATARSAAVDIARDELARIERFERAMTATPDTLACEVRSLIRRAAALPPPSGDIGPAQRERLPDYAVWAAHRDLTNRLLQMLRDRFGVDSLAGHPFARLSADLLRRPQVYADASAKIAAAEGVIDALDSAFENPGQLLAPDLALADAETLTAAAQRIERNSLSRSLDLLDPDSPASGELAVARTELRQAADRTIRAEAQLTHWRDPLAPADAKAALDLARNLEGSLLRLLQPAWWRLMKELKRRYDFGQHAVRPRPSVVVGELVEAHEARLASEGVEETLRRRYGVQDLGEFLGAVDDLREGLRASPVLRRLRDHLLLNPGAAAADGQASASIAALTAMVRKDFRMAPDTTIEGFVEWLRDAREALDDLPDAAPLLKAVHEAPAAYGEMLQDLALSPAELEALVASESLSRLLRSDPELARFDADALARSARRAAKAEEASLERNAALVRATQHRKFLENVRRSTLSVTQLDDAGRQFRKAYAAGRSQLEHEFGKTMRYRAIRELASGDSGLVVNDLKPVWLMSPLSVSDTLPLVGDLFDVVIFDEASQIPVEEAVPALSRAKQVVVVGDEMQLPPTSFFSAGLDEDESTVTAEEAGERIAITLDADSLLNQAARNLPATLLAWHYRSRYESLISFSNAAFYEGRLITIPDRSLEHAGASPEGIRSDAEDVGSRAAERLMERSLSFHPVADGVYVGRRNQPEAVYIARLVRELLRRETGLSIGIVAFSEAQQGEIETALETLAAEDPVFAVRLEQEYLREDDDQFNGLFVKNLENVQGDERDIIILSICYAPGPDGRMLMNFGPINQRGGEKRLNVIFSRARHRMAVVSTIRAEAITNTHNEGAAAFKAFLQFAEATARGDGEGSQAVLGGLNPGAREAFAAPPPSDPVRRALADALRARGHHVSEFVGRSLFRCDLAVAAPDGDGYALGVLLDSHEGQASVRERYVFRPGILRRFGWSVMDVPSADWLRDPQGVLARIEQQLQRGHDTAEEDLSLAPVEAIGPGPMAAEAVAPVTAAAPAGMREFRLQQGTSNKFWRIGCQGLDMTVIYGRIGSRGQTVVKSFETPERAQREVAKLIDEKLRKGYAEAD